MSKLWLIAFAMLISVSTAKAHYHMLLPDKPAVKKGEEVGITYQLGHPFEHELFDVAKPESLVAISPTSKVIDLSQRLEKIEVAQGKKKVTTYRFKFTPQERGDYLIVAHSAAHKLDPKKDAIQDTIKVILHVETQNGWDHVANNPEDVLELVPLTRPYGLRPGMVFRAEVGELASFRNQLPLKPLRFVLVEFERYNPVAPKELPPDEHITYTARSDEAGVVASTLPEAGWWCVTAVGEKQRSTLWVYVDGKIPLKPNE